MEQSVPKITDYTSLSALAACPAYFNYAYNERLQPRGGEESAPLHAGIVMAEGYNLLHTELKELWAKDLGEAHWRVCEKLGEAWGDFRSSNTRHAYLTLGHLEIAMLNYMKDRHPSQISPLSDAGEVLAERAVSFQWPLLQEDGSVELLDVAGKPDMPCVVAGQNVIVDLKCTTQNVNVWWAKKFSNIGHQLRIYMSMLRHHYGIYVTGAYVDGVHIGENVGKPDSYWRGVQSVRSRLFGPFNFGNGELEDTWKWVKGLQKTREFYEKEGMWPQNEGHCNSYGGCKFLKLCSSSPKLRGMLKAREFETWESDGILVSGADKQ